MGWQEPSASEFIERLADMAHEFGFHAGVGAMETAGSVISYLANHPRDLEPFMHGGFSELPPRHFEQGCLSWHSQSGAVVAPEFARHARIIKSLGKPKGSPNKDQPHDRA